VTINFDINHTNYLIRYFFKNKKYLLLKNLIYILVRVRNSYGRSSSVRVKGKIEKMRKFWMHLATPYKFCYQWAQSRCLHQLYCLCTQHFLLISKLSYVKGTQVHDWSVWFVWMNFIHKYNFKLIHKKYLIFFFKKKNSYTLTEEL